jgi:hypothetical protein
MANGAYLNTPDKMPSKTKAFATVEMEKARSWFSNTAVKRRPTQIQILRSFNYLEVSMSLIAVRHS